MWDKIEFYLEAKGMTQYKLSKLVGVWTGTITDIKKGRSNNPSFELVCKVGDALDVIVDELRTDRTEEIKQKV